MEILVVKIIVILIFLVGALGCTLAPILIARCHKEGPNTNKNRKNGTTRCQKLLAGSNSIAGGVLLATCFVALVPFVESSYSKVLVAAGISDDHPYAEITILFGFFLVIFVEQLITHRSQKNGNQEGEGHSHGGHIDHDGHGSTVAAEEEHTLIADAGEVHGESHAGHSHNHLVNAKSLLHSIILVITLGIHTLFEGIAIGLVSDIDLLVTLVIAVIIHEICCAVALGVNISQQKIAMKTAIAISVVFSFMMPTGIVLGMVLGEIHGLIGLVITAILQGIATGTFIYVLFMEIIPGSMSTKQPFLQIILMFLGSACMTLLIVFTHKHGHDHNNSKEMAASNGTTRLP